MPFPFRVNSFWLAGLPVLTKCINFCFALASLADSVVLEREVLEF